MSFQTRKTFVHLQNTNQDIFAGIRELSDPPDSNATVMFQGSETYKHGQFCEATRILFVHKENKNNAFIQQLFSPELQSSTILEIITTHTHALP